MYMDQSESKHSEWADEKKKWKEKYKKRRLKENKFHKITPQDQTSISISLSNNTLKLLEMISIVTMLITVDSRNDNSGMPSKIPTKQFILCGGSTSSKWHNWTSYCHTHHQLEEASFTWKKEAAEYRYNLLHLNKDGNPLRHFSNTEIRSKIKTYIHLDVPSLFWTQEFNTK